MLVLQQSSELHSASARQMKQQWEAEMETRREEEEVTCIKSALNVAHMKVLNSTFNNVQMDWSPEDRDGFSLPVSQRPGTQKIRLRSVTPKPHDNTSDQDESTCSCYSPCTRKKRRDPSPPSFNPLRSAGSATHAPHTLPPNFATSATYAGNVYKDDRHHQPPDDFPDSTSSIIRGRVPTRVDPILAKSRDLGPGSRGAHTINDDNTQPTRRGRTTAPSPIGLVQFS